MNQTAGVRRVLRIASLKLGRNFHFECLAMMEMVSAEEVAPFMNWRIATSRSRGLLRQISTRRISPPLRISPTTVAVARRAKVILLPNSMVGNRCRIALSAANFWSGVTPGTRQRSTSSNRWRCGSRASTTGPGVPGFLTKATCRR